MKLVNPWHINPQAVDKETCEKIMKIVESEENDYKYQPSSVAKGENAYSREYGKEGGYGQKTPAPAMHRRTDVAWLRNEKWIHDLMWSHMETANKEAGWNFDITSAENTQLGRYGRNHHFGWHVDGWSDGLSAFNQPDAKIRHGLIRKISMSLILNDDYEGGDFQFKTLPRNIFAKECEIITPDVSAGTVICFPAFQNHRVQPVISESPRYSAVGFFMGPPFK